MFKNTVFSCVVDSKPKFVWQCFIFVNSLIKNCQIPPTNIYVHKIGNNSVLEEYLNYLNVNIIEAYQWGDGKYCNKLVQFDTKKLEEAEYVFLCDCDIAFADDIREIANKNSTSIIGKTVDAPLPSLDILNIIYDRYNITKPDIVDTYTGKSFVNNCNGGLIGVPNKYFSNLGQEWKKFAKLLLKDKEILSILKDKRDHIDQISFSMALSSSGFKFSPISSVYNTPIHCSGFISGIENTLKNQYPKVLHFHNAINSIGLLKPLGSKLVDKSIDQINTTIQNHFNNNLFWDFRYSENPDLGSGVGSSRKHW